MEDKDKEVVQKLAEDILKECSDAEKVYDVPLLIGHRVRCKITGYRGVVVVKALNLYRVPQYHVVSRSTDGGNRVNNSVVFDAIQLEVLDPKPIFQVEEPTDLKFKLGDKLIDTVTKYKGVAVSVEFHMNGCIRWKLSSEHIQGDKTSMTNAIFDEGSLVPFSDSSPSLSPNPPTPNRGCSSYENVESSAY